MIEYDPHHLYQVPYRDRYAGLPVSWFSPEEPAERADPGSVAWRIEASEWCEESHSSITEAIDEFFERVDTERVRAIVIGEWEECYAKSAAPIVERLAANAARLPGLRSLFFGAITSDQAEISWIQQTDITPLLEALPGLRRLEVRGGSGLALAPVSHEELRVLRVETGGLGAEVTRAIGACDLPALEYLELWLGMNSYGGDTTVADLDVILSGERLPALGHLGVQDSEIQDEIAAAVAAAPVVAGLESLALSMGVLTDAGAEALLSGQPLAHLEMLDLHHHYLTDAMMDRVADSLPGVDVNLSGQQSPDEDWRYVAVGE